MHRTAVAYLTSQKKMSVGKLVRKTGFLELWFPYLYGCLKFIEECVFVVWRLFLLLYRYDLFYTFNVRKGFIPKIIILFGMPHFYPSL